MPLDGRGEAPLGGGADVLTVAGGKRFHVAGADDGASYVATSLGARVAATNWRVASP